ncbi:hypothetical protein SAMN05216223_104484 [Actinacidiphila yanglinensis]|uniref:C2H2-type domain-containing protein n=1 Tax=Actinacidiphila yanglinensis TaxID=310779 RepID=A0A1H5ZG10_9ACTN|nr:hypothetical protein [Actinacidiphila yanglinensis]SEG35211.1 hypothetical protein SAMN05216223_104484 [Actinacidiphila yanglinensis]
MSNTVGNGRDAAGRTAHPEASAPHVGSAHNVREAYAFACMNCGHGWEQAYEIEHHVDTSGRPFVTYLADGTAVPSPLTRPNCDNCGGHLVRIMRSGQVDEVVSHWHAPRAEPAERRVHHWSVRGLLHRRQGQPGIPGAAQPPGRPGTPAGPAA